MIGITGAAGFVGEALARSLAASGRPVRLFARADGATADGRPVTALAAEPGLFAGLGSVVHLAGLTSSKTSQDQLTAVNVELAADVARAVARAGGRRLVFFSSLGVHGKTSASGRIGPDEGYAPVNAYGLSKVAAEQALFAISRDTGLELTIIRPPMIYGPGGKGSFNALFKLVKSGLPLPLGLARAERSFCSVGNVISATIAAIDAPKTGVFLPADPEDFSTRDLIEVIASISIQKMPVLAPLSPWTMKAALRAIGLADMAASLFEPLVIDRAHWRDWSWTPVETGRQALRDTVIDLSNDHGRAFHRNRLKLHGLERQDRPENMIE